MHRIGDRAAFAGEQIVTEGCVEFSVQSGGGAEPVTVMSSDFQKVVPAVFLPRIKMCRAPGVNVIVVSTLLAATE